MALIQNLNDMQAVYCLHRLTSQFAPGANLEDEEAVRQFVEHAAHQGLGADQADEFMALFEDDRRATDVARACLTVIRENPEMLEGSSGPLESLLESPPATNQMDLGISFGLLALAGMAMFLAGSLKIKTKDFELDYQGSEVVGEVFGAILSKLPS